MTPCEQVSTHPVLLHRTLGSEMDDTDSPADSALPPGASIQRKVLEPIACFALESDVCNSGCVDHCF